MISMRFGKYIIGFYFRQYIRVDFKRVDVIHDQGEKGFI
jgi:hypothetical protein